MINDPCCNTQKIAGVTQYTPAIPKFYWDVDSQEQGIKQLCKTICMLIDFVNSVVDVDNELIEEVEKLQAEFEKFKESGFDDYYREQIEQWFRDNALEVYKLIAKQVFFGLTSDGYFCAYIPDSWSDIIFDTGAVYGTYTYGRLILRYNVDGSGVIDNTGYGAGGNPEDIKAL